MGQRRKGARAGAAGTAGFARLLDTAALGLTAWAAWRGTREQRRDDDCGEGRSRPGLGAAAFGPGLRLVPEPDGDAAADRPRAAPRGPLARLDALQQQTRPLAFVVAVLRKFGDDQAGKLAALVAYYGFFSIFPLILALVSVLGITLRGRPDLQADVVDSVLGSVPVLGSSLEQGALPGSGLALAVGLAGALWAGMAAMEAVYNAMNEVWDVPMSARRSLPARRARVLLMLVVIGLGLVGSTLLGGLATALDAVPFAGRFGLLAASIVNNALLFLLSFRILCDRRLEWSWLWPGALLAGAANWALQTFGFALMSRRLSGAGDTYGAFGAVIGLLSWFFLVGQITIFCAEVNVVRARRLWPRSLTLAGPLTDADRRAYAAYARAQRRVAGERVAVALPE
ncbi:MAG: YihY/virulence factor BrkB family protein [Acidimicrobiales bacterium]